MQCNSNCEPCLNIWIRAVYLSLQHVFTVRLTCAYINNPVTSPWSDRSREDCLTVGLWLTRQISWYESDWLDTGVTHCPPGGTTRQWTCQCGGEHAVVARRPRQLWRATGPVLAALCCAWTRVAERYGDRIMVASQRWTMIGWGNWIESWCVMIYSRSVGEIRIAWLTWHRASYLVIVVLMVMSLVTIRGSVSEGWMGQVKGI